MQLYEYDTHAIPFLVANNPNYSKNHWNTSNIYIHVINDSDNKTVSTLNNFKKNEGSKLLEFDKSKSYD